MRLDGEAAKKRSGEENAHTCSIFLVRIDDVLLLIDHRVEIVGVTVAALIARRIVVVATAKVT